MKDFIDNYYERAHGNNTKHKTLDLHFRFNAIFGWEAWSLSSNLTRGNNYHEKYSLVS